MCEMAKRKLQPFVVIDKNRCLITTETKGINLDELECQSKNRKNWKQYLKPCAVYQTVNDYQTINEFQVKE